MSDTSVSPDEDLVNELQRQATSNDTNQNRFTGGDMDDLLNDGVPGYETTGVEGTDDDIAQQQEVDGSDEHFNAP
ncbi:MAG: hypothetical protein JJT82_09880 [Legionellaceae bacterium]|nr:hypothetical protein [Legionellaceae bacterium]